jgi:hypothetical protein
MRLCHVQGGEGQHPPKRRWQERPHQKWVHLVFLSARPESFKGLTVSCPDSASSDYADGLLPLKWTQSCQPVVFTCAVWLWSGSQSAGSCYS